MCRTFAVFVSVSLFFFVLARGARDDRTGHGAEPIGGEPG
jgi:hypothetical protein